MSDARILHKKASGGERVCALSHLEHRVWVQYVLSADDYGVLRHSVSGLRHDNPRLEQEPMKRIEASLQRTIDVGLIQTFAHQGTGWLWQLDWQDFQGIRYPRATVNPAPSDEELKSATKATRKLFSVHPQFFREDSGDFTEKIPIPAGAGAARNPHSTSNPTSESSSEEGLGETKPLALAVSAIHPGRLIDGAEIRRHGGHAWCSWPGRDGLCVPRFLQDEFAGKHGNAASVLAWYPTVIARYQGVPIGEDALVFWRHEFAAWVGTVTAAPSHGGKGNASRDAMARVLQKRAAARGETL